MTTSDERRLAKASRLLRRRMSLAQTDMPSRYVAQQVEAGRIGHLSVDDLRAHFARMDASVYLNAWWHGAALDRLIDARHAAVVEASAKVLTGFGWRVAPEVTFADFGERGSVDLLAGKDIERALLVGEAKSEWGSVEETLRRLNIKTRLAPKICLATFGWRPSCVASLLIFPEDRTARRIATRFAATLEAALPADGRAIRSWLKKPDGNLRGIWFLTNAAGSGISGLSRPK